MKMIYADETYKIHGAIYEVYKEMGCGFLEAVYQECLENEFSMRGIPYSSKSKVKLSYKSNTLKQTYEPDFICYDKIIVEIKALKELSDKHQAQVLNYLKATKIQLGLLVNFGAYPKAETKRLIWSH